MKKYQNILYLKIFIFCGEIFNIFEQACFRNGTGPVQFSVRCSTLFIITIRFHRNLGLCLAHIVCYA